MKTIAPLMMMMMTAVSAFAPQLHTRPSTTAMSMGLFDFLNPPKEEKPQGGSGKMDSDVFGGKGARITVREDEDVSMVVVHALVYEYCALARGTGKVGVFLLAPMVPKLTLCAFATVYYRMPCGLTKTTRVTAKRRGLLAASKHTQSIVLRLSSTRRPLLLRIYTKQSFIFARQACKMNLITKT